MQTLKLPFLTLTMLISFASVNAVLFTPALPDIARYFAISEETAQYTLSWFLIGYTIAQLFYGPITSRFGRKHTLYFGVLLQIFSCGGCFIAGLYHQFSFLVFSRFLMALGSGVGLKMTFTLINENYEPKRASQKISYLMLAFAITPGLGTALGGLCNRYFGWMSCFVLSAVYGGYLLYQISRLPNFSCKQDKDALNLSHLYKNLVVQFRDGALIMGSLLMGATTCFIYVFATLAPFIAINNLSLSTDIYGVANILPAIGLIIGCLLSAQLIKKYSLSKVIKFGIFITLSGVVFMSVAIVFSRHAIISLFLPMAVIEIGLSLILANASTLAMRHVKHKAHGSAVMNFINMTVATTIVLGLSHIKTQTILLPLIFGSLALMMLILQRLLFCTISMSPADKPRDLG